MTEADRERIAVVTGVSHRAGIGFAIAQRLLRDGAKVLIHSWGAGAGGMDALTGELGGISERLQHFEADLGDPDTPGKVRSRRSAPSTLWW